MPLIIDYRSDTVTRPTPAMLEAMFSAKVGDDVLGEDPTVQLLEQKAAAIFGMEAGLFCPSGTMTNQIAIKVHTQPGDEVICDALSHIYLYEGGGIAFNSGASVKLLQGNNGRITAQQVAGAINPNDVHKPQTTLVSLENTSNRGGGSCYTLEDLQAIHKICHENQLKLHLDGARLFNALVATGQQAGTYGKIFHSISICLSKGLGTPVGSVLLGSESFIARARRVRKVLGGGMRQAGYLAAAGIYALDHHVKRLALDHEHAKNIAAALQKKDFVGEMMPVETNIIIFEVKGRFTPKSLAAKLEEKHIKVMPISPTQVRMVLHLDIHTTMVDYTLETLEEL
jgi:threonine aldolase